MRTAVKIGWQRGIASLPITTLCSEGGELLLSHKKNTFETLSLIEKPRTLMSSLVVAANFILSSPL